MDENARLHETFRQINAMLWGYAEGVGGSIEDMEERIGREAQRIEAIIAAYTRRQAAMLQKLIREEGFSKFPLPGQRIRIWTRIRARLELRRAIRS